MLGCGGRHHVFALVCLRHTKSAQRRVGLALTAIACVQGTSRRWSEDSVAKQTWLWREGSLFGSSKQKPARSLNNPGFGSPQTVQTHSHSSVKSETSQFSAHLFCKPCLSSAAEYPGDRSDLGQQADGEIHTDNTAHTLPPSQSIT